MPLPILLSALFPMAIEPVVRASEFVPIAMAFPDPPVIVAPSPIAMHPMVEIDVKSPIVIPFSKLQDDELPIAMQPEAPASLSLPIAIELKPDALAPKPKATAASFAAVVGNAMVPPPTAREYCPVDSAYPPRDTDDVLVAEEFRPMAIVESPVAPAPLPIAMDESPLAPAPLPIASDSEPATPEDTPMAIPSVPPTSTLLSYPMAIALVACAFAEVFALLPPPIAMAFNPVAMLEEPIAMLEAPVAPALVPKAIALSTFPISAFNPITMPFEPVGVVAPKPAK